MCLMSRNNQSCQRVGKNENGMYLYKMFWRNYAKLYLPKDGVISDLVASSRKIGSQRMEVRVNHQLSVRVALVDENFLGDRFG